MTVAESLTASGLLLDIIGAGMIAVPDIPRLNRFSKFGRLRLGREKLESGGVSQNEIGYTELNEILEEITPAEDFNEDLSQFEEIVVNQRSGYTSNRIRESGITWGDEYVEARYDQEGDLDDTAFYEVAEVFNQIRKKTEPQSTRIRTFGFITLASGFLLQLLGTVL